MTHSGESWRLGHRPALDGLRAVAIGLVLLSHFGLPGSEHAGQAGVDTFFVLSGFLITSLLLEEWATGGRIRFGAFYARRALRLGPALVVCVVLVWSMAKVTGLAVRPNPLAALFYVMDFVLAGRPDYVVGLFSHTWSLAIEEQFYLLWPLLLAAALSRRIRLVPALLGAIGVAVAWFLWLVAAGVPFTRIMYAPDTRSIGLLAGCALAAVFHHRPMPRVPRWAFGAALAGLPLISWAPAWFGLSGSGQLLLTAPVAAVVVWGCVDDGPVGPLGAGWLRLIGARSYGLYLWHLPVIGFVATFAFWWPWWARVPLSLALMALFTALSWRYVERPFLSQRSGAEQPVHLASGQGTVPDGHVGEVPDELEAAREVLGEPEQTR